MPHTLPFLLHPILTYRISVLDIVTGVFSFILILIGIAGFIRHEFELPQTIISPETQLKKQPEANFEIIPSEALTLGDSTENSPSENSAQSQNQNKITSSNSPELPLPEAPENLPELVSEENFSPNPFEEMLAMPSVLPRKETRKVPIGSPNGSKNSKTASQRTQAQGNTQSNGSRGNGTGTAANPTQLRHGSGAGRLPAPPYPERARRNGWQGIVVLAFATGPDGRVIFTKIISAAHDALANAVVSTAKAKWNLPQGHYQISINFNLE